MNVSKVQIAELSGITKAPLDNALQVGAVRTSTVEAIAKTLGIKVGYLFDDDIAGLNAIVQGYSSIATINNDVRFKQYDRFVLQERTKHLAGLPDEKLISIYERMMEAKQ